MPLQIPILRTRPVGPFGALHFDCPEWKQRAVVPDSWAVLSNGVMHMSDGRPCIGTARNPASTSADQISGIYPTPPVAVEVSLSHMHSLAYRTLVVPHSHASDLSNRELAHVNMQSAGTMHLREQIGATLRAIHA